MADELGGMGDPGSEGNPAQQQGPEYLDSAGVDGVPDDLIPPE